MRNCTPTATGLSPQVRGNPLRIQDRPVGRGSIPASAGEPRTRRTADRSSRVYPRKCGGTGSPPGCRRSGTGLSPQVRGNPIPIVCRVVPNGSIPASAGEPGRLPSRWRPIGVYPRKCGGTRPEGWPTHSTWGLSPQVRGNHRTERQRQAGVRSIPASAGEPICRSRRRRQARVYPRKCGGTA